MVNELEYELKNHCSREGTLKTTDKDDNGTRPLRKTMTIDQTQKTSSETGIPLPRKCFSSKKTEPAMLAPVTGRKERRLGNMLIEKQELKRFKT